jgi:transcriptional regulator with GAF, ATPase, and Fis domain
LNLYSEIESLAFLESFLKDEDIFVEAIQSLDVSGLISLYDAIKNLRADHKSLFHLVFRLKKIIQAANHMTQSLALHEALERIVDETCECLDCDRASVFIVDYSKDELWSKVAKGTASLRIPRNKGVVGHVANSGETLNILNAYQDERFNKEIDIQTNYKTNTLLCVPILDERESDHVIGDKKSRMS